MKHEEKEKMIERGRNVYRTVFMNHKRKNKQQSFWTRETRKKKKRGKRNSWRKRDRKDGDKEAEEKERREEMKRRRGGREGKKKISSKGMPFSACWILKIDKMNEAKALRTGELVEGISIEYLTLRLEEFFMRRRRERQSL